MSARPAAGRVRRERREGGQSLTEFALVAPVFFLLVFGIVQLGLLFGGQNGLVNATREIARYAATDQGALNDPAGTCTAVAGTVDSVMQRSIPAFNAANATPSITYRWLPNPGGSTYSMTVTVDLQYAHPLYVPLVGNILDGFDGTMDGKLRLDATEVMRVEGPPLTAPANPSAPAASCT